MTELTCVEIRESAAEYALGILTKEERSIVAAHLLRCPDCRAEVAEYARVGDDLLELIPDAEAPLGFDRKVLAAVHPRRRSTRTWIAGGVAAAAAAAAIVTAVVQDHTGATSYNLTATFRSGGRTVGSVYTKGQPKWLWMSVHDAGVSGPVMCELEESDGRILPIGSFELVQGNGAWAAPEPASRSHMIGARLVAADGSIVATAVFSD